MTVEEIAARADQVRDRIARAGGDPDTITLLAVSKGFPAAVARDAVAAGLVELGENYAQDLVAKAAEVDGASWHFIGNLQRNKVRSLAGVVDLWQTVDRLELGTEIARRAPSARVLVQVNVSDEPQKGGCRPGDAPALVSGLTDLGLHVEGLMTVGRTGAPSEARAGFEVLARIADDLDLATRSMGMSGDLEEAVAAGSTMVRIGAAIFGPRPARG